MPESSLAVMPPATTALQPSLEWLKQLDLVQKTVAPGLNQEEFQLFCHVAKERHLDPLQRQIYAVRRRVWNSDLNNKQGGYEDRMTIQTGIDGFRSIANRTGVYMPSDKLPLVEGEGSGDLRVTVWVKKFHEKSGQWMEFGATAYYREFVQVKKATQGGKAEPVAMWEKMPLGQTEKCAEAKVLRRGWPEELGQIYVEEEMQQAGPVVLSPDQSNTGGKKTAQTRTERDLGKMKPSNEPNRGHGHEGTQRENVMCNECRTVNGHTDECKSNPNKKAASPPAAENITRRDAWLKQPGHDPKIHIAFKDGIQIFELQRNLSITDEQMKNFLDKNFEIQHRYLIPQSQFQAVLDAIRKEFEPKTETGTMPAGDGLFQDS